VANKEEDPYAAWRQMLSAWESNTNSLANRSMASEEFSKVIHNVAGATHGAREAFGTAMQRYLAAMGLPSRQEIEAIGERLRGIEAQLYRLTQLLEGFAGVNASPEAEGAAQKPKRTRRPPEAGPGPK